MEQTQAELKQSQAELRHQGMKNVSLKGFFENKGTKTSMMIERKSTCENKLSEKKCKKLKKKNKGNGCRDKGTQKKCIRTCGLCPDGKLGVISFSQ